jgi:hypothetical protein
MNQTDTAQTDTAGTGTAEPSCTAFDHERRIAAGSYDAVAVAVKAHLRTDAEACVLIFDDATGRQIDFDLRGTDREIAARIRRQFPRAAPRPVGRPKLGVVGREVTLLPRHWAWLAEQPGGASVALRRLVDEARRSADGAAQRRKARERKAQERAYAFMSAMAGNRANFEEAARALFAGDTRALRKRIAAWPADIRRHVVRLLAAPSAD